MKNLKLFKSLLVLIGVLITSLTTQMWAKTFYFHPDGNWTKDGAKFGICYGKDGGSNTFLAMTAIAGTEWYSVEVPSSASSQDVCFMRCSSIWNPSDGWTNKWNTSGWFSYGNGDRYVNEGAGDGHGAKLDAGFESSLNGIHYNDGSDHEWSFNGQSAQTSALGTKSTLKLTEWFTYEYENKDLWDASTVMMYNVHRTAVSAGSYTSAGAKSWDIKGSWDGGYCKPKTGNSSIDINLLSGLGSGLYTMSFYYYDPKLYITSPTHTLTWTIAVPSVSGGAITSDGSGSGTSGSPFLVADGDELTLTAVGSQASTDANSVLYVKWGSDSYAAASSTTKTLTPTTEKQSITVKLKYYNSADDLSGSETTLTIYYQSTVTPAVTLTSVSPSSSIVAGNDITLVGARTNSSNAISFQYTTNDGSTWTDITPKTTSGDSQKTITWTVPDAHGATQTFKFRACLAADSKESAKSSGVTVYNTKTFKLKNEKSWSDLYLYAYNGSGDLLGSFPGIHSTSSKGFSINKITNSGLWWNVTITSECTYYIVSNGSSGSGNQTTDIPYGTYSNGGNYGCYNATDGLFYDRSSATLSAPSVSTSSVTPTVNNAATIGGNVIGLGNDLVTSYGYYYSSTNSSLSGSNLTGATKVQVGTNKNATGTYSKSQTGLAGGTTYYVIAYATNGHSTVYGSQVSFTTPYKVTITNPSTGGAFSSTGAQYVSSTLAVTCTASTGYTFSSWTAVNCGMTSTSTTDGVTTATLTPTADDATLTASFSEKDYTVTVEAGDGGTVASAAVTGHIVTTTTLPAATNSTGYHFVNWTVESGTATITNASSATTATIHGMSDDVTVKANFEEDKYIYFDNSYTKWDHVWVYLFNNDVWYNNKVGDDGPGVVPKINRVACEEMTLVEGEEYLYKYAYHNSSHNYSFSKIAFAKADQHNNGAFWRTEAVYRGDWNATMPIYVAPSSYTETNETKYHSDGYWMMKATTYNESVGYALRHKTGGSSSEEIGTFKAIADGSHIGAITVRYDNTNNRTYFINNISSQNYSVDHTFTSTDDGTAYDLYHYNDIVEFTITPTSVGNYTIFLEQGPEHMQISVQYPVQTGDRRLVYSFTKDASTKYRYSDVIRAANTSAVTSFYIDKDQTGAALKLQRCTGFDNAGNPTWADVSGTTGWLSTYFGTAAKGVYVMTVNFAGTNDVSSTISDIDTYSGPYYIKTDCAPGGWANYTNNALTKNTINFAADDATTFDYYMCKYISNTATNLRCVIANDYNNAISDTIKDDAILNRGGTYETLPISSSVRFSYNSTTNELKRTYLLSSNNSRFLVLKPKQAEYVYSAETSGTDYYASLQKFGDNGHWTYVLDAWVYPGAIGGVYADYPDVEPIRRQILVDPETNYLMGGTTKGDKRYHVRLVYDFKTNYLTSAWIPSGAISAPITLNSDFMLVRSGQQNAQQLSFSGTGSISEAKRAYGVFEIKKDSMTDSGLASWGPMAYRQCIYYFSFPFDVRMSDVFGAGVMGTDWRIQKYNGAKRAEKGWFGGDGTITFWEDLTIDSIMHKNEGYCLMLNRRLFHDSSNEDIWTNEIPDHGSVYLYFPSKDLVGSVTNNNNASLKVPSHECTINRYFTQDAGYYNSETDTWDGRARNHMHTDSHWNMIGSPLFEDKTATNVEDGVVIHAGTDSTIHYIYAWNSRTNTLSIRSVLNTSFSFKAMYAYMAQYTGTITFSGASIPASVAARAMADTRNYNIELTLSKNDDFAGRAYVELSENADDNFKLNEDVYMMRNSNLADVYTFAGGYDVAANVLSVANHIIPVGVNVKSAGTYTFSMPSIFTGTVILVDTLDQTRTDLSIDDYEVDLSQGEINDRFFLEININQVVTSLENENGNNTLNDGGYHKFIRNDQMFILKNGVVYDAQGRKVE